MRSISAASWFTSCCSAWRSEAELLALADCTASSRMRCRLAATLEMAPSAVCSSEMPSLALRMAWFCPRIWLVNRSAMASPAASSRALLTRKPLDSRWMEVASVDWLADRFLWAVMDAMPVLITKAMVGRCSWPRLRAGPHARHPRDALTASVSAIGRKTDGFSFDWETPTSGCLLRADLSREMVGLVQGPPAPCPKRSSAAGRG